MNVRAAANASGSSPFGPGTDLPLSIVFLYNAGIKFKSMKAKIVVLPLLAVCVGGCAWLNEQPYYIPGASYVSPYVRSCYTTPVVVVKPGCRPTIVRQPIYHAYRGDAYGHRRHSGDAHEKKRAPKTRPREAHKERDFAKNVGKAQMKVQRPDVKMQQKQAKAPIKTPIKAAARAKKR